MAPRRLGEIQGVELKPALSLRRSWTSPCNIAPNPSPLLKRFRSRFVEPPPEHSRNPSPCLTSKQAGPGQTFCCSIGIAHQQRAGPARMLFVRGAVPYGPTRTAAFKGGGDDRVGDHGDGQREMGMIPAALVVAICLMRSRVEIEARAGPPRSCCGSEPAAVHLKVAFRAAGRPDRSGLVMAGPRPARGLISPACPQTCHARLRSARTLKCPSFRRFL